MKSVKKLQELRVSLLYLEQDARKLELQAAPILLAAARKEVEEAILPECSSTDKMAPWQTPES